MKTGLDGGDWCFNSSIHLKEIAIERGIPSYHIDSAERIRLIVEHRLLSGNLQVTENWLPEVRSQLASHQEPQHPIK